MWRLATVTSALVIGVLVLFWAGTPASAYTPPPTVPNSWAQAYIKVVQASNSADPVTRNSARRILTRAIGKAGGTRFLASAGRAGLLGAAAAPWVVVYYELKYANELGDTVTIPTSLNVAPAHGAMYGYYPGNASNGEGTLFYRRLDWSINSGKYSVTNYAVFVPKTWVRASGSSSDACNSRGGLVGVNNALTLNPSFGHSIAKDVVGCPGNYSSLSSNSDSYSVSSSTIYRVVVRDFTSSGALAAERWGPELCKTNGCSFTHDFPLWRSGSTGVQDTPFPSPSHVTTPQEGNQVIEEIVTDPEIPTVIPDLPPDWETLPDPPEDPNYDPQVPDPDDPFWTDPEAPEDPTYDPQRPINDPDEDGLPNETDPDDDNDGIPDEDDPRPYSPAPVNDPAADPDGDGLPNETDPDDDNDGIPDEDDPDPYAPTNPDSLPDDHPYADPDRDGSPNHTDPDDDGDSVPDQSDPAPLDPTVPDQSPNGDPDRDGIPNENDDDDDGDGVPDRNDPAPYDPTVPEGGPDGDPDLDGMPNKNDPAPYDPTVPEGGPDGDPDLDGVPNKDDPAPNDPAIPGSESPPPSPGSGSCPVPRPITFDLPDIHVEDVFPFSLMLWAWGLLDALAAPPVAPVLDLGIIGSVDLGVGMFASVVGICRTLIWVVAGIGMAWVFYTWIRSGSS